MSSFAGEGLETAVKLAFVNGFPEDVSVALQQLPNVPGTVIDELISKVQVLTVNRATGFGAVAVKEKAGEEWQCPFGGSGMQSSCRSKKKAFRGKCFKCQSPLLVRDRKADMTYYCCGKVGYVVHYLIRETKEGGLLLHQ